MPEIVEALQIAEREIIRLEELPRIVTKEMVDRFLSWKLPQAFLPDGGITFKPDGRTWPIGTNLLTSEQARVMLEHVLAVPTPGSRHWAAIKALVDEQAEDAGLWFAARTAPEAYLQLRLRELHALIEQRTDLLNEVQR